MYAEKLILGWIFIILMAIFENFVYEIFLQLASGDVDGTPWGACWARAVVILATADLRAPIFNNGKTKARELVRKTFWLDYEMRSTG